MNFFRPRVLCLEQLEQRLAFDGMAAELLGVTSNVGIPATNTPVIDLSTPPSNSADGGSAQDTGSGTTEPITPSEEVVRLVSLSGVFPRHVRIIDIATDEEILSTEVTDSTFDLSSVPAGNYVLYHAAAGETQHVMGLAMTADSVTVIDPGIPLAGAVPQRVIISDTATGEVVWDYWHYSATLNVLHFLPNGVFKIQHAESGGSYRDGRVLVGAKLPSYRLFAERTDSETVSVDWGALGTGQAIHVRVSDSSNVLVDEVRSDQGLSLHVPSGFVQVEVTLPGQPTQRITLGTPPLPPRLYLLTGPLPSHVKLINSANGQTVLDREISEPELDLSGLADGDYLLLHSSNGQIAFSVGLEIAGAQVTQYTTALTLPGNTPRLIRITDTSTDNRVWDYWHYSSELDVVGLLAPGEYLFEYAASGESWRTGVLKIGSHLPSYRLYAERSDSETVSVDWGFLGPGHSVDVKITDGATTLMHGDQSASRLTVVTRSPFVQFDVTPPNQLKQTIFLGEQPSTLTRVSIPGALPRHVEVVDTTTGQLVLETELTTRELDISLLRVGYYVVYHTGSDQNRRSFQMSLDGEQVVVQDTVLYLDGSYPRRIRVQDQETGAVVWDYWHYGSGWDIVGSLPAGRYSLLHAASGEPWQIGDIRIGPGVSSYRVYTERTADDHLLIDWGNRGLHAGHRVRVIADGEIVIKEESAEARITVAVPGGAVTTEVIPITTTAAVKSNVTPRVATLKGQLPRHVILIDTASGEVVLESDVAQATLDVSALPLGNYLLKHFATGQTPIVESLAISAEGVTSANSSIPIVGALPQKIRITNQATKAVVWEYYHYANVLNVMRILPEGVYVIEHAAPGQAWQRGILQIGAKLPSYRLFVQMREAEQLYVNWGPQGTLSHIRLQVSSDQVPIFDGEFSEQEVLLHVPRGVVTVEASVPNGPENSVTYCSLETRAADGSCRSFANTSKKSQVAGSNQGLVLSAWGLDETTAEFTILQEPQHGSLHRGDSTRIQTYTPTSGFVGIDSFTYRVATPDGQSATALFTIQVDAPGNPDHAYFVPGYGTIHLDYETPDLPEFAGSPLPRSILVNSDFGRLIERIEPDGTVLWRHQQATFGRAVAVVGNEAVYTTLVDVRFLDVATGNLLRVMDPGLNPTDILSFANPIDSQNLLIGWYDTQNVSYLGIWNRMGERIWTSAQTFVWPRWADKQGDTIVVADTYGHRVVGESFSTHDIIFQISTLWPGDVEIIGSHRVLLTEEHADRVWIYDWVSGDRELVMSAPGPRSDLSMSFDFLVLLSNSTDLRIDPASGTSQSKSSKDFSGIKTLYAPNGVSQLPDGSYLVADTDNSRVIHVSRTGEVLAELLGFNSPTKVAWIPNAADLAPPVLGMGIFQ